ncbi:hypothetical protein HUK80_13320, partial [Flavobacterium sp. MAH-1]
MRKSWLAMLLFMLLLAPFGGFAQNISNYAFSTSNTGSLEDLTTGATSITTGNQDSYASSVLAIGFDFWFMGVKYTHYSVGSNGILRLSTSSSDSAISGTYYGASYSSGVAYLAAFGGDNEVNGGIRVKTIGSAPNRKFVIEWTQFYANWNPNLTNAGNLQAWLSETTGVINYVYGEIYNSSSSSVTKPIFISAGNTVATAGHVLIGSPATFVPAATAANNTIAAGSGTTTGSPLIANLGSSANGSRVVYTFTPPSGNTSTPTTFTSSNVSATNMTVNWVDASTSEGYFTVGRSTSPSGPFTVIGAVTTTTSAGTGTVYSFPQSGLTANTTYYYEITALNETGGTSPALTGSASTIGQGTYVWNATAGSASWASSASWTPARTIADPTDILQFSNGGSSTATDIPTQTVGTVTVSGNTAVNFQSAAASTLTMAGLTIDAGSSVTSNGTAAALSMAFSSGAVNTINGRLEIANGASANGISFSNSVTTVGTTGTFALGGTTAASVTSSGTTLTINGTYEHKYSTVAGTIPTATWGAASNVNILGYTTATSGAGGLGQNFANFTWNTPSLSVALNMGSSSTTGVSGAFTVTSTGTGSVRWATTGGYTLNINNYTQTGGNFQLSDGSSGTSMVMNVTGTFNQSAGSFGSSGTGTNNPTLNFSGTSAQNVSFSAQPTGPITYRISNANGINLNGNWGTTFNIGSGTIGALRISTAAANPVTFGGTLTGFQYNAAGTTLTYDAAGSYASRASEFPSASGPLNVTVAVGSGNVLDMPFSRTIGGTLTMTSGDINLSTNSLTLGTSSSALGTLSYTAGSIRVTTGSMTRWFGTSGLPTSASTAIGHFPLASGISARNASVYFSAAGALSTAGTITVSHNGANGISAVSPSFTDGAYTVDTRTNGSWTFATGNGIAASGTINLRLTSGGMIASATPANLRVIQAAGAVGTHVAGTTSGSNYLVARTGLSVAQLGQTHYVGSAAADMNLVYNSIASGDWNSPSTWSAGSVPTCADAVTIASGHNVTVNSAANVAKNVTINSGGTLTVASGDLTVGCTLNNNTLAIAGTLTVTGGSLKVNGNFNLTGKFNQSGGTIAVDGNNGGSTTGSVASGTNIVNFAVAANADIVLTAGTFTIVDPHTAETTTFSANIPTVGATEATGTHTFRFGDGVSADAGSAIGFQFYSWAGTGIFKFRNVIVESANSGANRFVYLSGTFYNFVVAGDMTINAGGEFRNNGTSASSGATYLAGNLVNNGTFTSAGGVTLGNAVSSSITSLSVTPSTVAQTVSGSGTFRNLTASPTANFNSVTINNTNATGVTLNVPLSISGTLTMTSGLVNTSSTSVLQLGTATASGSLSGTPSATSMIVGPFARTFGSSRTTTGSYTVAGASHFPIGKGGAYTPVFADPNTTSGGSVIVKAEAFTSNSGTQGTGVTSLSTNRYEAVVTSGAANLTNMYVRLNDAAIASSHKILQASSAAGEYSTILPSTTFAAGNLTTATPILAANYTGYFAFGNILPCVMPANQPTAFVASAITNTSFTGSFTAAASNPTGYLVVRYPSASAITDPVDFTLYAAGNALGAGTVVYFGSNATFPATGLTASTAYDLRIYSFNNTGCSGPVYNVTNPLAATVTTCASAIGVPGTPVISNPSTTGFTATWTASSTSGATYLVDVATNSTFTTFVPGYQNFDNGTALSVNVTGLAHSSTYYVRVRALVAPYCSSGYSSTATGATLCEPIATLPWTENFDSMATIGSNILPICWVQQTGSSTWTSSNAASNTYNDPRSGAQYMTIYYGSTPDYLWTPGFQLAAGQSCDFSFYFVGDNTSGWNAEVLANATQSNTGASTLGAPFIAGSTTTSGSTYTLVTRTFTAPSAGVYYFGVKAYTSSFSPFYLGFDDFRLQLSPTSVSGFTPSAICQGGGTTVTVSGTSFTGATAVSFNGVPATSFTVVNGTTITAVTPAGVTAGAISVTAPLGNATSGSNYTVTPMPVVSGITGAPSALCSGDTTDLDNATPGGVWASSNSAIATVDASGVVTAVAGGTVDISYSVTDLGCTTSVTATIVVNDPIVSSNPVAQTVVTGSTATFSVNATGAVVSYQWMVSVDGGDTFEPVVDEDFYSGATTNTLTITDTPESLNGNLYMVVITAEDPCPPFESGLAVLNVGDTGIATDPASITICSSGTGEAQFTVVASGTVDSYAWQVDQGLGFEPITDGTFGSVTYSGATTDVLTVSGLTLANTGWNFQAVVTGPANGATSNPATLTVNEGVAITTDPASASSCYSGGSAVFTVAASGAVSGYQWQYSTDNATFNNVTAGVPVGATYSGATTASLTVNTTAATPAAGTYFYRAVVNGAAPCAAVPSNGAQMQIYTPVIGTQPSPATVFAGNSTTFTVSTSEPSPSYQWQYGTSASGPWSNVVNNTPANITYANGTTATLTVNVLGGAAAAANRYYRAVVTSASCSVNSNSALLTTTNYCFPTYTAGPGTVDQIANVTLGTLNNSTGSSASPYYTVYDSATVPDIQQLTTANISVKFGNDTTNYCAVWIDFNQNGVFESSEGVASTATSGGSTTANGTSIVSLPVPLSAIPGKTRMRVRGGEDVPVLLTQACGASSDADGEAEDYFVNIVVAPNCSGTPAAATASASQSSLCISGSVVLTATNIPSGAIGLSTQWYNTVTGAIAGTVNSATYTTPTLTANASYFLRVTCADSGLFSDSNTVTITVNNPTVTNTAPAARCGVGTVTLGATASAGAQLNWYAAATGGSAIATGPSFTTPSISTTTDYFVSASSGESTEAGGKLVPTGTSTYIDTLTGIVFNATSAFTLNSAQIYAVGTGSITVGLYSSTGTELMATSSIPVTGLGTTTPITIPIGFAVPVGTGYRLMIKSYTGLTGIVRDGSPNAYPFNTPSCSVTGGYFLGSSASYYFFYNLSITTRCESARTLVKATVNTPPALTLSGTSTTICAGTPSAPVAVTSNVASFDSYVWSPAGGVSGNATSGFVFNPSVTTTYTLTASQTTGSLCANTATYTVNVNPVPQTPIITPASLTVCSLDAPTQLTATLGVAMTAMSENFDTNAPNWTITNGSSSPAVSNWAYVAAPYTDQSGSAKFTNFSTPNGGKFALANADAGGSGSTTNTVLTSPTFSTVGMPNARLTFEHAYRYWASGDTTVKVEISTNGGSNWTQLADIKGTDVGATTNDAQTTVNASISLNSYLNEANVKIRFNYVSTWGYYWILDNVKVATTSGTEPIVWTPSAGLFTDAAGTVPYTGTATASVYAKPTVSTQYTATATTGLGCTSSSNVMINVNTAVTWYVDNDSDGYGNSALPTIVSCSQPAGYAAQGGDCNDTVAAINPGHAEVAFNGIDDDCDGTIDEGSQLFSQVLASQCGTTLTSISSLIGAVSFGAPVDGYRFRVVNTTTNAVQTIDRTVPNFSMTMLASYDYATTYSISVMLRRNGIWLNYYGNACLVSTPAVLDPGGAAAVTPSQCGIVLPS